MRLYQQFLTNNACYKANVKHTVKGIMVHSTGANNPWLKTYVQPDDGRLGKNPYGNAWNVDKPGGRSVCVHAFIGKDKNGSVCTYQTLPWNIQSWHSGTGTTGKRAWAMGYLGIELCEDGGQDKQYFNLAYKEYVELCAFLCKKFNLNPLKDGVIIGHYEGYKRGIASNHADPANYFGIYGKTMDGFRNDVAQTMRLSSDEISAQTNTNTLCDEWARDAVNYMISNNILQGANDGYHLNDYNTREEFMVFLHRLLG